MLAPAPATPVLCDEYMEEDDAERTPTLRPTEGFRMSHPCAVIDELEQPYCSPERKELRAHGVEELDDSFIADMDARLARRPSRDLLVSKGVIKTPIASTGEALVRRSLTTQLDAALGRRPSLEDLMERGIVQPKRAPSAAQGSTPCAWPEWVFDASQVERMTQAIARRPSVDALVSRGVLKTAVAAKKEGLERRSRSRSLGDALERRPSVEALLRRGITPLASALNPALVEKLEALVQQRSSASSLAEMGLLKSTVAVTKEALEWRSRRSSLGSALEKRPSAQALMQRGILRPQEDDPREVFDIEKGLYVTRDAWARERSSSYDDQPDYF